MPEGIAGSRRLEQALGFALQISRVGLLIVLGWVLWSSITPPYSLRSSPSYLLPILGGGLFITLLAFPLPTALRLPIPFFRALFAPAPPFKSLVTRVVQLAWTGRSTGVLSIESELKDGDDPALAEGVKLAAGGTEPHVIEEVLKDDQQAETRSRDRDRRILQVFGRGCGLAGGVVALITASGSSPAATALSPLLAGLLVFALAEALSVRLAVARAQQEVYSSMILDGVLSLQSGDHPALAGERLIMHLEPRLRPHGDAWAQELVERRSRGVPIEIPSESVDLRGSVIEVVSGNRIEELAEEDPEKIAEAIRRVDSAHAASLLMLAGRSASELVAHLSDSEIETVARAVVESGGRLDSDQISKAAAAVTFDAELSARVQSVDIDKSQDQSFGVENGEEGDRVRGRIVAQALLESAVGLLEIMELLDRVESQITGIPQEPKAPPQNLWVKGPASADGHRGSRG